MRKPTPLDVRLAKQRLAGKMSGLPNIEGMKALAAAVVEQAINDARDGSYEERSEAMQFLEHGLWTTETPFADALSLEKTSFQRTIIHRIKAEAERAAFPITAVLVPA